MPTRPIRIALLALTLVLSTPRALDSATEKNDKQAAIESNVVKIFVQSNPPDLFSPWQKAGVESSTGSGVILDGERILTAAHVIEDAVSIEVKRAGGAERFSATLLHVGHACDLALLKVDDPAFFKGVSPLKLGEMPEAHQEVQAYGFPVGGESLSVTSGIISRIEINNYVHSWEDLLLAQIDAAINEGNSGGPVMADGLAGIAVQSLNEAESVGYMIPVAIIDHFLDDVADGRFDGFPALGVEIQDLESEPLRQSLGMKDKQGGVLITRVDHGSPASGVLKPGDVLLSVDGKEIASDTTIEWPRIGRVAFTHMIKSRQIGDRVKVSLLRDGKTIRGEMVLTPHTHLVPGRRIDDPEYLVFSGLVFQPLTIDYLVEFEDIPYALANYAIYQNVVTQERAQVIMVQKVLPHTTNRGYHDWDDEVLATVNGTIPQDMQHLARIIDEATGPWLKITTDTGEVLTLDLKQAREAQPTILDNFGIAHDRSAGLRSGVVAEAGR